VNFTEIMARCGTDAVTREAQFALRALMEVPEQYKVTQGRQQLFVVCILCTCDMRICKSVMHRALAVRLSCIMRPLS
jgi:hypothetical protein